MQLEQLERLCARQVVFADRKPHRHAFIPFGLSPVPFLF